MAGFAETLVEKYKNEEDLSEEEINKLSKSKIPLKNFYKQATLEQLVAITYYAFQLELTAKEFEQAIAIIQGRSAEDCKEALNILASRYRDHIHFSKLLQIPTPKDPAELFKRYVLDIASGDNAPELIYENLTFLFKNVNAANYETFNKIMLEKFPREDVNKVLQAMPLPLMTKITKPLGVFKAFGYFIFNFFGKDKQAHTELSIDGKLLIDRITGETSPPIELIGHFLATHRFNQGTCYWQSVTDGNIWTKLFVYLRDSKELGTDHQLFRLAEKRFYQIMGKRFDFPKLEESETQFPLKRILAGSPERKQDMSERSTSEVSSKKPVRRALFQKARTDTRADTTKNSKGASVLSSEPTTKQSVISESSEDSSISTPISKQSCISEVETGVDTPNTFYPNELPDFTPDPQTPKEVMKM